MLAFVPCVHASPAPDGNAVLILGSAVPGGEASQEAREASELGFTVVVASDAEWASMSREDFASYRAILLGDPTCGAAGVPSPAEATKDVWGGAVTGNRIVLPPTAAGPLSGRAIRFLGEGPSTGLYFVDHCKGDPSVLEPYGSLTAVGQGRCPSEGEILAILGSQPSLSGLPDTALSSFHCEPEKKDWTEVLPGGPGLDPGFGGSSGPVLFGVDRTGTRVSRELGLETPETGIDGVLPDAWQRVPLAGGSATTTLNFSGSASMQSLSVNGYCDCNPFPEYLGVRLNLDVTANWTPTATIVHQFSPGLLRQGETFTIASTLTPGSGALDVTYTLSGDIGQYDSATWPADGSKMNTVPFSFSTSGSGTCSLRLDGDGGYSCAATKVVTLYEGDLFGIAEIKLTLPITTTLSITPDGVAMMRTMSVGSTPVLGPSAFDFHGPSPSKKTDTFAVPCNAPVGTDAFYDLTGIGTDPSAQATTKVDLGIKVTIIIKIYDGSFNLITWGPSPSQVLSLSAPDQSVALGSMQADNRPPVVNANGPYAGTEGVPVHLSSAGTTDNCASTLEYVWNLSDGGVAYGASPYHAFDDNATYSGQLVVTDLAGNRAAQAFTANVANGTPVVNAGPDTQSRWGVPVEFNGSATDPGSADQLTLGYAWVFGDGTPSATGGPGVTHAYAAPGTYTATFSACDKDGACASDSRDVTVTKRNVSLGYLGDHNGVYDTLTHLGASLVDEFGQSVNGRPVAFSLGSSTPGPAATNSSGIADLDTLVGLDAGTYPVTAGFAGDSMYNPAAPYADSYTVARKASSIVYTGDLRCNSNSTITMSAILTDSSGKPLAGRLVAFQLGSQSASGTTGSSGVAVTTLKVTQHNGSYTLTSTWTPSGADANRYLGASDADSFNIGPN